METDFSIYRLTIFFRLRPCLDNSLFIPKVLGALAPIIVVVGVMQPINSFVYVGEGILEGSKDFVYEASGLFFDFQVIDSMVDRWIA